MAVPRGREKNITGESGDISRRGEGLGTGPVGNGGKYEDRKGSKPTTNPAPGKDAQVNRAAPKGSSITFGNGGNSSGYSSGSSGHSSSNIQFNSAGSGTGFSSSGSSGTPRRGKNRLLLIIITVVIIILLFKMCSSSASYNQSYSGTPAATEQLPVVTSTPVIQNGPEDDKPYSYEDLFGGSGSYGYGYGSGSGTGYSYTGSSASGAWHLGSNTGMLNASVADVAREKLVKLKGNNKDTVTIMVYMCGTDLESQSAMGSYDLQEMAAATLNDNVNIIVYTGGCKRWRTSGISNTVNQIYRIRSGSIERLESDMGSKKMTDPGTLSEFIKYCKKNFKASRNILILWDHGGGSLSGYGYDEKYASAGSMTLVDIRKALKDGGVIFDFIGFDACLMATVETGLAISDYADYMIASEESEPGVGWYYTNWITKICANTSVPTLELGKIIVDDFVSVCAKKCAGQSTTLSVVDLGELEATVPDALSEFAEALTETINDNGYTNVSNARSRTREFASSSRIDQMDIADFANMIGTDEAKELVKALLSAVKYNGTSTNMTNAYGLSIYFPYKTLSYVSKATSAFETLGISDEYIECVRAYAGTMTGGQAASGGSSSPLYSLFGDYGSFYGGYGSSGSSGSSSGYSSGYGGYSDYGDNGYGSGYSYGSGSGYGSSYYGDIYSGGSSGSSDYYSSSDIYSILSGLLTGNYRGVAGVSKENSDFIGRSMNLDNVSEFIAENRFDPLQLVWKEENGEYVIALPEDQWNMVTDLELNVFYDDGEGFLDLGLDTQYSFTEDGKLIGTYDGTWTAINNRAVAYYTENTVEDGDFWEITGYVPVLLNGERADLILVFNEENPYGYVAGSRRVYKNGETETQGKIALGGGEDAQCVEDGDIISFTAEPAENLTPLKKGDVIDFVCDFYSYDGEYIDSFMFGEPLTVDGELSVSYVYLPDVSAARAMYRFSDIYQQTYWTTLIP